MTANLRPKTPIVKEDVDISDENVYNTLLKSWNNIPNTPKAKIISAEGNLNNLSSPQFVTPTKIPNLSLNFYPNEQNDNSNVADTLTTYNDMILNPSHTFDKSKRDSITNNKDISPIHEVERTDSTNEMLFNPRGDLSEAYFDKSVSTNNMQNTASSESKNSFISNNGYYSDSNIVSKNKMSIYKQFKKFNWNDLTPKKSGKERKMSFESNNGINFSSSMKKTKSLMEKSDSINHINSLLTTPLLKQDLMSTFSDSGSLSRPQVRSSGSQAIDDANEDVFDNSPFEDAIPEMMFNSDALKRRSLNPRSSFSSSLDIFNPNDVLTGEQNGKNNEDTVFNRNIDLSRSSSITSNFRDVKFDYLNNASDGVNNFTSILDNKDSLSPSMKKHMTPPLLLKKKSSGLYNYQINSHLRSKSISMKNKVILLDIPFTNDNFDQVLGVANIVETLKKKTNTDVEWVLTMTYITSSQEEILVSNMANELKTTPTEAMQLINDLKLKNDKEYLKPSLSQSILIKEHPELKVLNVDHVKPLKTRLLNKQANVYDVRNSTNSRYSSITTIHDGGEIIKQPIIGEMLDDVTTVHSHQNTFDNTSLTAELNAPYLPLNGSSYLPKHLTVRLYDHKHFNDKEDINGYLKVIEKVFTSEDYFMSLWNAAMKIIDNDNVMYQEYNFRNKTEDNGVSAKIHFFKPSNEIQLVVDEYFTAYNKEKFDAFKKLSCSNNGVENDKESYVDSYEILTKIYQGDKKTLYV